MKAEGILKILSQINIIMNQNRDYLIELDSVVGDGDLGLTMGDGFKAAYESVKVKDEEDIGKLLYFAGKAMSTAVPSTMGTLMASGLMQAGKVLKGKQELENEDIILLWKSYFDGVQMRGKAEVGDKTFLDGLYPAIKAMENESNKKEIKVLANLAYEASKKGFEETTNMIAVHGRAATRGEDSRKLRDPGAAVAVLLMEAFMAGV